MGKTGAKFVIGLGFALIFFSLFFTTWKASSAPNKAAYLALKQHDLDVKTQEPIAPKFAKISFPTEQEMADKIGLGVDAFKDKLGTTYNDMKKKFEGEGNIKKWNEDCDKAAKGDLEAYKNYVKDYTDYSIDKKFSLVKNDYENDKDIRALQNNATLEQCEVGQYRWHRSFFMYFGVLLVTAGFVMLTIHGEGNEKVGALIGLAAVLWFICQFWGGVAG